MISLYLKKKTQKQDSTHNSSRRPALSARTSTNLLILRQRIHTSYRRRIRINGGSRNLHCRRCCRSRRIWCCSVLHRWGLLKMKRHGKVWSVGVGELRWNGWSSRGRWSRHESPMGIVNVVDDSNRIWARIEIAMDVRVSLVLYGAFGSPDIAISLTLVA